jgi:signal transduction histidine kinase/ligand-binding sensor domain-containing protein/CheY-like chemotaxis protein
MKRIILLVVCVFVSVFSLALDPHKKITQYIHEIWGIQQGLPQNSVYTIIQTGDGYLWLGTEEGLARFDGVRFKIYDKGNLDQLINNSIYDLYEDREGNLWIGTYGGGLTCLDVKSGEHTLLSKEQGLSNDWIFTIYEDHEGGLWIGTNQGLNYLKGDEFTIYTTKHGLSHNKILCICEDRDRNLWIGTERGLNLMNRKDSSFTVYTTEQGLSNDVIASMYVDREGNLWIGTYGGLNLLDPGKGEITRYTKKQGLTNERINSICEDRDGNLWLGTYGGGLNRLDAKNGKITAYTTKNGFPDDTIWKVYEDREGSLWIGTDGGGLNRLRDGKFTTYTTREGLSNNIVWSVYEDGAENLWIGTNGGGLNCLSPKDGKFTAFTGKEGLSGNRVWAIHEDREGNLWVGTDSRGVNRLDAKDGKITTYTTRDGLSNDRITSIYEDREGNLWLGTYGGGLNRLNPTDGKVDVFTKKQGLTHDYILTLYEDREGALWIGTELGGISRFKNGTFTTYTTKQGLSHNIVNCFYQDRRGNLWIATYGGGLNRFKDGEFTHITGKEGLFNDRIYVILEDDKGNFWMSCNKGIFRVSKKELEDFCDGKRPGVHCISYNEKDGMKSRECRGSVLPAGWKGGDGKLWFPTAKGVVMIDPNHIKKNPLPPPVVIEKISADHINLEAPFLPAGEQVVFSPGNERFEIHYTGLSFLVPDRVRFQYKLEGYDPQWSDGVDSREAHYTKLPPGNYTFRVKACNNDGIWNETGTSISFYLKPYFYQSWWFYLLCGLVVIFLVYGGHRWRVRQLKKREAELETLVAQRTSQLQKAKEIAQEEREIAEAASRAKSEFLARMSHEIRTPMHIVTGFMEMMTDTNLDEQQMDYAAAVNQSAEAMITIIDDILDFSKIEAGKLAFEPIDFSPEETAFSVCELILPRIGERPIELLCRIGNRVPAYVKQDAGRFRQVLINLMGNAVKFTKKGEIELAIDVEKEEGDRLVLCSKVRDTGIGIPSDKLDSIFEVFQQVDGSTTRKFGGTGLGLSICKQIAKHMEGDIQVESTPGKGSTFYFYARVEKSKRRPIQEPTERDQSGKRLPAGESTGTPEPVGAVAKEEDKEDAGHSLHILVAEDNPLNRKLARHMLTGAGYRLDMVENGKQVVEKYISAPGKYDLILMDIQMPEMDGREATRMIREKGFDRVPIIAMTAESMKWDRQKCFDAGMNDYISKPIRREIVFQMIKKWVKQRPSPPSGKITNPE